MTDELEQALATELRHYQYEPVTVRYSEDVLASFGARLPTYEDERTSELIQRGNQLTQKHGNDAVAKLGLRRLRRLRAEYWKDRTAGDRPVPRRAWILRSLKRPEEITLLRHTYGDAFYALGISSSYESRLGRIETRLKATRPTISDFEARSRAQQLIEQDQSEAELPHGQNVRKAFPMADVVVSGDNLETLTAAARRFVRLLFGENEVPTCSEHAMYLADGTSALSSSLSRKVGAALVSSDGSVLAVGANEVPRAGGGQYSATDVGGRDMDRGADYSTITVNSLVASTVQILAEAGWLADEPSTRAKQDADGFATEAIGLLSEKKAPLMDLIEFQRPVHAEVAAILDAARRGVRTEGSHLYTTTYPCHLCTKEIVAAGVAKVVYIEPYPKSRAEAMYGESITSTIANDEPDHTVAFIPFHGVTPRAYRRLFDTEEGYRRKDALGRVIQAPPEEAQPRTGKLSHLLNIDQRERARLEEVSAVLPDDEENADAR